LDVAHLLVAFKFVIEAVLIFVADSGFFSFLVFHLSLHSVTCLCIWLLSKVNGRTDSWVLAGPDVMLKDCLAEMRLWSVWLILSPGTFQVPQCTFLCRKQILLTTGWYMVARCPRSKPFPRVSSCNENFAATISIKLSFPIFAWKSPKIYTWACFCIFFLGFYSIALLLNFFFC
jgi:hypothetical protein